MSITRAAWMTLAGAVLAIIVFLWRDEPSLAPRSARSLVEDSSACKSGPVPHVGETNRTVSPAPADGADRDGGAIERRVRGRLVDARGAPVASSALWIGIQAAKDATAIEQRVSSSRDGGFEALWSGPADRLFVRSAGDRVFRQVNVDMRNRSEASVVDVGDIRVFEPVKIELQLIGGAGVSMEGLRVRVRPLDSYVRIPVQGEGASYEAVVDAAGRCALRVAPGTYYLWVRAKGPDPVALRAVFDARPGGARRWVTEVVAAGEMERWLLHADESLRGPHVDGPLIVEYGDYRIVLDGWTQGPSTMNDLMMPPGCTPSLVEFRLVTGVDVVVTDCEVNPWGALLRIRRGDGRR